MQYIIVVLYTYFFSITCYAQNTDSIKVDILLDSTLLNELDINEFFINSVEYTSEGFIVLSSPT